MDFISFSTVIIMAVTILFTITPQLHILQLNSYYNIRFWGYLKENLKTSSVMSVVFSALVCVLYFVLPVASLVLASLLSVVRISHAIYKTKTAKKKNVCNCDYFADRFFGAVGIFPRNLNNCIVGDNRLCAVFCNDCKSH